MIKPAGSPPQAIRVMEAQAIWGLKPPGSPEPRPLDRSRGQAALAAGRLKRSDGLEVRVAESDADLEAFIRIRRALFPNESGGTVELMRADLAANADRRFYVAELDGEIVGSGLVSLSDLGDRFSLKVRVLPHARRRGVGTALLGTRHPRDGQGSAPMSRRRHRGRSRNASGSARRIARSSR